MSLFIRETFVNDTENVIFGEGPWIDSMYDTVGSLFRALSREYGRCVSKMYVDKVDGRVEQTGWVFEKRMRYEGARRDYDTGRYRESDYYIRHVWVHVSTTDPEPHTVETPVSPWATAS